MIEPLDLAFLRNCFLMVSKAFSTPESSESSIETSLKPASKDSKSSSAFFFCCKQANFTDLFEVHLNGVVDFDVSGLDFGEFIDRAVIDVCDLLVGFIDIDIVDFFFVNPAFPLCASFRTFEIRKKRL